MGTYVNWRLLVGIVALSMTAVGVVMWTSQPVPRYPAAAKLDFTLKDLDGKDVRLADLKGRPLLINFWETFCVPCQYETPDLVALDAKYRDRGLVIVGISMHDEIDDVRTFVEKYKMRYTVLIGGERDDIANAFALLGYPTSFFIRRDGTIAEVQLGIVKRDALERKIENLF